MAVLWLANVLRASGLSVFEVDGWRTRSAGTMQNPTGVLGITRPARLRETIHR